MDLAHYQKFRKQYGVCQNMVEWQVMLEFFQTYFSNRGIESPIVVELGVERNNQRRYFKEFQNARHIGIDWSDKHGKPDILGDALAPETLAKLMVMLNGEKINLLMAELDLPYDNAQQSYEMYGPLTENIICFHSVCTPNGGVQMFWQGLCDRQDEYLKITMFNQYPKGHEFYRVRMGKGILVKSW